MKLIQRVSFLLLLLSVFFFTFISVNAQTASGVEWGSMNNAGVSVSDNDGVRTWDASGSNLRYIQIPVRLNVSESYARGALRVELPKTVSGNFRLEPVCSAVSGTKDGWTIEVLDDKVVVTNAEALDSAAHNSLDIYYIFDCWNVSSGNVFSIPVVTYKDGELSGEFDLQGQIVTGYNMSLGEYIAAYAYDGLGGVDKETAYIDHYDSMYETCFGFTQDMWDGTHDSYYYDIAPVLVNPTGQQPYDINVKFSAGYGGELVGACYMRDAYRNPYEGMVPVGTISNSEFVIPYDSLGVVSGNLIDITDFKTYVLYFLVRYPKTVATVGDDDIRMTAHVDISHVGVDTPQDMVSDSKDMLLYSGNIVDGAWGNRYHWAAHTWDTVNSPAGLSSLSSGFSSTLDFRADFFCLSENYKLEVDPNSSAHKMVVILDLSYLSGVSGSGRTQLEEGDYRFSAYRFSIIDNEANWSQNNHRIPNVGYSDYSIPDYAEDSYIYLYGETSLTEETWTLVDKVKASDVWAVDPDRAPNMQHKAIVGKDYARLKVEYTCNKTATLRVGYRLELLPEGNVAKAVANADNNNWDSLGLTQWFDYMAYDMEGNAVLSKQHNAIEDPESTFEQARLFGRQHPQAGYPDMTAESYPGAWGYSLRNFSRANLGRSQDSAGMLVSQILYDGEGNIVGSANSAMANDSYCQRTDVVEASEVVYTISGTLMRGCASLGDLQTRRTEDFNQGISSAYTATKQRYYVLLAEGLKLNTNVVDDHYWAEGSDLFLSPFSSFYQVTSNKAVYNGYVNSLVSNTNVPGLKITTSWNSIREMGWSFRNGVEYNDGSAVLVSTKMVGNRQLVVFERTIDDPDCDAWYDLWGDCKNYFWGRGLSFSVVPMYEDSALPAGTYDTQFFCQFLDDDGNPVSMDYAGDISSTAAEAFGDQIGSLVDPSLGTIEPRTLLSIQSRFTNRSGFGGSSAEVRVKRDDMETYGSSASVDPLGGYSYELSYSVTNGIGTNVVLWDNIESYNRDPLSSEWWGTCDGVDLNGNTNVKVYVKTEPFVTGEYVGKADASWLTDGTHGWTLVNDIDSYDWSGVKSIAFSFGSRTFSETDGKSVQVYIKMKAPRSDGVAQEPPRDVYYTHNEIVFSDEHRFTEDTETQYGSSLSKPAHVDIKVVPLSLDKLPGTGGPGVTGYILVGLFLIFIAVGLLWGWHSRGKGTA